MIYFTDSPLADESVRQLSDVDPAGEQQAEETHRALPGEWKRTQKRNYFQHANGTRRLNSQECIFHILMGPNAPMQNPLVKSHAKSVTL